MIEVSIEEMLKLAVKTVQEVEDWKDQHTFDIVLAAYRHLKEHNLVPIDFVFEDCDKFVTDDGYTFYLFKDFYGFKKFREDNGLADFDVAKNEYLKKFKQFIFEYISDSEPISAWDKASGTDTKPVGYTTNRGRAFPWVGLPTKYLHMYYKSDQKESIENDE